MRQVILVIAQQLMLIALWGLSFTCFGAIVNNNHLFQQTERLTLQLQAIRQQQGLPEIEPFSAVLSNKLPISLLYKTLALNERAQQLADKVGLPSQTVNWPEPQVVRPRNVMPYLEQLMTQLTQIASATGSEIITAEVDRPIGKTANDVYRQLLQIERLFEGLAPDSHWQAMSRDLSFMTAALKQIGDDQGLPFQVGSSSAASGKQPTDVHLVAYQCLHLTEGLMRKVEVEAMLPGPFPTGEQTPLQVADTLVMIRAELDRMRQSLGLSGTIQTSTGASVTDSDGAYGQLAGIRDGLLKMVEN